MTTEQLADFEARIRRAVASQQALGVRLGTKTFGVYLDTDRRWKYNLPEQGDIPPPRCCPLGCLIMEEGLPFPSYQDALAITEEELDGFWSGFDGVTHLHGDRQVYEMACRLRAELLSS